MRECEASLRRLNIDAIDLYQVHWLQDDGLEEAREMTDKLRCEGKVRFTCVSNYNSKQLQQCIEIAPISSLQAPYSLINREYEYEILPYCKENEIGVIVYSPMESGL